MSYESYVTKHIIETLGLKNTLPDLGEQIPKKLVPGYERWTPGTQERVQEPAIRTFAYAPATGFISDVKDLAKFLSALHPDSGSKLLSREARKQMLQVQSILNSEEMYGLGLCLESLSGQDTYGHSGGFAGYVTNAICHKEDNIQVIVLTNTQSNTAGNVSYNLMRTIYKLSSMKDASYKESEPYSGIYRSRWGDMSVVAIGDSILCFGVGAVNPVKAWSLYKKQKQHTFQNTDTKGFGSPGETLRFRNIKEGRAQLITGEGNELKLIK